MRHDKHRTLNRIPSSSTSSSGESQRWSEVVPPHSALTFGLLGDSDDHMSFSDAQLTSNSSDRGGLDAPSDAVSQVLTIAPSTITERHPSAFYFGTNGQFLVPESPKPLRHLGRTRTSSTLDGQDVYVRGSLMGKAHVVSRHYSCFDALDDGFEFDPMTPFAKGWEGERRLDDEDDEGFFETEDISHYDFRMSHKKRPTISDIDGWSTLDSQVSTYFSDTNTQSPKRPRRLQKKRPSQPSSLRVVTEQMSRNRLSTDDSDRWVLVVHRHSGDRQT